MIRVILCNRDVTIVFPEILNRALICFILEVHIWLDKSIVMFLSTAVHQMILMRKLISQIKCNVMTLLSVQLRTTSRKLDTSTNGLTNSILIFTNSIQSSMIRKYPNYKPCIDIHNVNGSNYTCITLQAKVNLQNTKDRITFLQKHRNSAR